MKNTNQHKQILFQTVLLRCAAILWITILISPTGLAQQALRDTAGTTTARTTVNKAGTAIGATAVAAAGAAGTMADTAAMATAATAATTAATVVDKASAAAAKSPGDKVDATIAETAPVNPHKDRFTPVASGSKISVADPASVIVGLLLIVLLIISIAWMLRRMGAVPQPGTQTMKIIAGLSVGTREKVLLIDIKGKQMLVGVAPGRVSALQYFDEPVIDPSLAKPSEFSLKIKQLMQQGMGKSHND